MTHESPTDPMPDEVSFGPADATAPAPGRAHRTGRALTWVAVGAIGATVLTGVAFAATGENSTESSATPSATASDEAKDPAGRGHGGRGGMFGGLRGDVLHGEFVVKDGDTTKTMLSQNGEVTAASSTSLTVKSTDGFTATWSLSSSTKVRGFALAKDGDEATVSDVKVGAKVHVVGSKSSATSGAATQVGIRPTDAQLAELKKNAPNHGPRGDGDRPGAPAPAPTASATGSSTGA